MTTLRYPNIRDIPREAWKQKEWPITKIWEKDEPQLTGTKAEEFEKKRQAVKERLPYKDDEEVPF